MNMIFVGRKRPEYYRGFLMKADTGLHEQISDKLLSAVPPPARILDLGAGEGALSARLKDIGYSVVAVDVDGSSFKCSGVAFEQINFDEPGHFNKFSERNESAFDAVLSIEVIEHVEDQWTYVRQLLRMVKPLGMLLITTPNISSWLSRFLFFFTGKFSSFDDHGLTYGHINPISAWELGLMLERCGAKDIVMSPAGTLPMLYLVPTRELLINLVVLPFRPFMRGLIDGWCLMATALKPQMQNYAKGELVHVNRNTDGKSCKASESVVSDKKTAS